MSVYKVIISNGKKTLVPVADRETYLRFRQSGRQRQLTEAARRGETFTNRHGEQESVKTRLEQYVYSCLPNADGTLAQTRRLSDCVSMDIDYPGEESCGKNLAEWKDEVKALVESKQEEVGVLLFGDSATKGFHLVFRRHAEKTQEENLRWASDKLGVAFDKNAKDHTRVLFEPSGEIYILRDEIFQVNEMPCVGRNTESAGMTDKVSISHGNNTRPTEAETPSAVNLHAFDLCVEASGLPLGELDKWGEHNWHNNLMAILSVGLPKLMTKGQLFAVVASKLPNYSQTEDCTKLINYFYEKYSAEMGYMNATLRQINSRAQARAEDDVQTSGGSASDKDADHFLQGWNPPAMPKKGIRLLDLLVSDFDPRFRVMLTLSALPVLSALASHFRATYLSGKVIGPQQYVAVIGGSGSGKGNCADLYNRMVEGTLKASDEREWDKVRANAELREKMTNAKERPPKYHPKLRLFETTSKSSILELQTNLGKGGMLLGHFTESDTLVSALRSSFSDIGVLLRKGWSGEDHTQFYMSDSTCNTSVRMSMSLLMAGTVKSMLERFFSDNNCEGGLMQRFIPVLVPKMRRTFRPPRQNFLTQEEREERDTLLETLFRKDLALGDDTLVLETPMMLQAIGRWFDELEERYNDGNLSEAEADLSHRCGEFMLRAAIPLIALNDGKETKEIVDFCRWVGEYAHYSMSWIFAHRVQEDIVSSQKLLKDRSDSRKTAEPLLNKLPKVFSVKELKELREREGQSSEVKMLLSRYCKKGKIVKIGKGMYSKAE